MIRAVDDRVAKQAAPCIALCCRTLTTQRYAAAGSRHVSVWQVGATIEVFAVVARVAVLAKHWCTNRQQRRRIRTVRRVAVGAVVSHRSVLTQERTALLCVARIAGLVHRLFHQQLRSRRSVWVVTVRTAHLALENRMPRETMHLRALVLVATEANLRLRQLVHHLLVGIVRLVAIGTG